MRVLTYFNGERTDYSDFNCHNWKGCKVKKHSHADYYEIVIMTEGTAQTTVNGQAFDVKKGDVIIMSPGIFHEMDSPIQFEHYNVAVKAEYFKSLISYKPTIIEGLENGFLSFSLSSLSTSFILSKIELIDNENFDELTESICVTIVYVLLCEFMERSLNTRSCTKNSTIYYCKDAISKIDNGKYVDMSVSRIISLYPVSAPSFIGQFKQITGSTPKDYLFAKKLAHAKKLLITSKSSIIDISLAVGFSSVSHFIKVFKSKYGESPLAFRKNSASNRKIHTHDDK